MGRVVQIGFVLAAFPLLSGQAVGPSFEDLCASIVGERTEFTEECIASETEAHFFVMSWFDQNGLLTPEGQIDSLQLMEAQTDPMRGLYETPASTAAFCIETTGDWIGMSDCILISDQSGPFMGSDPSLMGPEYWPEPGMN
jgi:hypothetical protein